MPSDFISITFQQRARLSTTADGVLGGTSPLQAAAAASSSSSMSRFGRAKWALVGTTALAVGTAAAISQMKPDESARAAQAKAKAETDRRYQELLNSYGSGDSLDDLEKAVSSYGASQSKG